MKTLILVAAIVLVAGGSRAQDAPRSFRPVLAATIANVIVPAHTAFTRAAEAEAAAVADLCAAPGPEPLQSARATFVDLVDAFGHIEMYRFGPAREDNRAERLFFWPDRRGRGLRQVQGVLAAEDETAASPATLKDKSVALQGLPALEFVLFGAGSAALEGKTSFRCRYAAAIAVAIADVAAALEADWRGPFAALVDGAGPDNPAYRSHGEAYQDILQAGAEQLELVDLHKIGAVIGDAPEEAHPRRAPFWRSGATLSTIAANLAGVRALLTDDLAQLLREDAQLAESARYELNGALERLAPLMRGDDGFLAVAKDPVGHRRLSLARYPIDGAHTLLGEKIPATLGLVSGFNSLDGD